MKHFTDNSTDWNVKRIGQRKGGTQRASQQRDVQTLFVKNSIHTLFSVLLKVFHLISFLWRKTRDNNRVDSLL